MLIYFNMVTCSVHIPLLNDLSCVFWFPFFCVFTSTWWENLYVTIFSLFLHVLPLGDLFCTHTSPGRPILWLLDSPPLGEILSSCDYFFPSFARVLPLGDLFWTHTLSCWPILYTYPLWVTYYWLFLCIHLPLVRYSLHLAIFSLFCT